MTVVKIVPSFEWRDEFSCLSDVKIVWGILVAMHFTEPTSGTRLLLWAPNMQKSTCLSTSLSCITRTQGWYLPKAVGLAADTLGQHSIYTSSPSAMGSHHLPSMLWAACVFSASLEIPGWLANPVWVQTTSTSHGSENICLNTKWETTHRLLEDYEETLKKIQKSVNQLLILAHWQFCCKSVDLM